MAIRKRVSPPSKRELFILRVMIITGLISLCLLLFCLFSPANQGNRPLYWLLISAIIFSCLKILHEWYHYFYITIPERPVSTSQPTVDILTTFCAGEPYEMIVNTLTAMQAITYPHTSYLCDEANDPFLKETCERLGVRHVTRNNRINAKAGNINNALQYASGELCVVMDPDHVPTPDFLDRVVPYFDDPQIGFVQIVQAYSNIGDSIIAKGAAQQTFQFYGPMMMTMHKYGTVQAIGANCTFRRSALDSIGGHAAGLAEDMHTAMQLHAKGWQSVYVPEVLTLGLVPSTLSAYYKQQLKWSRGTFELLVTSYPELFRKFTWRQKLHYGILPFHYFAGVIFLINFLVPVLSLCLGVIPFQLDLVSFGILGLPFVCTTLLIRHFVQRWVMGEEESGFHMVGGLLLIGAWWIYILGLVYTVIRKKVPYIPTPKDDKDTTSWKLLIPNATVLLISAAAIVYGLWRDWTPFSGVMAGLAFLNCLIMLFNIMAGIWKGRMMKAIPVTFAEVLYNHYYVWKIRLWKLRHSGYVMVRKTALFLTLLVCGFTAWFIYEDTKPPASYAGRPIIMEPVFLTGIFSPANTSGLTSMQDVGRYNQLTDARFDIVSCYIPWGDAARCFLQDSLMNAIYQTDAVPMITWEPWAGLFHVSREDTSLMRERKMMQHISQGYFDEYLQKFAEQVRKLERPVFIRFGHEPDNPAYPWSGTGLNTPEEYVQAWRYVHDYFDRAGARNAIWVWTPWKPEAVAQYFPGNGYVDWLGVTILNYGSSQSDGKWYTFQQLYTPYHNKPLFRAGLPVMVAELGSLKKAGNQQGWLQDAFADMGGHFPEIKAAVLFNSSYDLNIVSKKDSGMLDWKLSAPLASLKAMYRLQKNDNDIACPLPALAAAPVIPRHEWLRDTVRGVIYSKAIPWFRSRHTLTRREVTKDLKDMQHLGINTLRRYGPGVYDHNILAVANETGMKIQYAFWMPDQDPDITKVQYRDDFRESVIATVRKRKDDKSIISWHLGNNAWHRLQRMYVKPSLLRHEDEYLHWLRELVQEIKAVDPGRPVTLDVPLDSQVTTTLQTFASAIPEISCLGLATPDDTTKITLPETTIPWFISGISVDQYIATATKKPLFISSWQDVETRNVVTFNGLLDHERHYKPAYSRLADYWHVKTDAPRLPPVKILRPAQITYPGMVLSYHALVYSNGMWNLQDPINRKLHFEWFLYKTDGWGNAIYMHRLGTGRGIQLSIPDSPELYRLYLIVSKDGYAVNASSPLNTPFRME
ncbi:glycosyltransferase [Chitinophaga ginsengisoli]|uniref:Cellulose synthase/poly-beta-1,6-N-acetylglucosamine synthase-like glycosyltransferase n=1 Tax=Chitinophaga ginsengisoli TaxID=363837 RepID=A0A2P8FQQ8_9BACT|nr:glycosyltransferase [Chitinophaga ginsengisoli]PSL24066.1 cellulose synthase/poly-beta-1,6-N-acetylglucosamine synthase-like glycosyltransferase [Chitinophaga ginsengisoli]